MLIMSDDLEIFATALHQCAALWRARLDERLRPSRMSQTTWRALWLLKKADKPFNQSTLASRLGIETPTLVRILDRIEKLGLIARVPCESDRRQKYLEITESGLALVADIESDVIATRHEMLAGLSPEDLEVGISLINHIIKNAESPA